MIRRGGMRAVSSGLSGVSALDGDAEVEGLFVSTAGNDSTGDGSIGNPWRTIEKGLEELVDLGAGSGVTLWIRGGSYSEEIDSDNQLIPTGTSFGNAPRIAAYNDETVNLSGGINLAATSSQSQTEIKYVIFQQLNFGGPHRNAGMSHHTRFDRCDFTGGVGSESGIRCFPNNNATNTDGSVNQSGGHEFLDCRAHHNGDASEGGTSGTTGHGGYVQTSANLFDGCQFDNNGHLGIQIYSENVTPTDNVIRRCTFFENSQTYDASGMAITLSGEDNTAYNCLIYDELGGIEFGYNGATGNSAYNNTIVNTSQIGIQIRSGISGMTVRNNIVWSTGGSGVDDQGSGNTLSHNLSNRTPLHGSSNQTGNPQFVDGTGPVYDLHIQAAGAADENGTTVALVTEDYDGNSRPQGSVYDIGAYELV